jgi:hypothetical protein
MRADPRSGDEAGHTVIERPPPGLARGHYPAPPWAVLGLGSALLFGTLVYFALRMRGRVRR